MVIAIMRGIKYGDEISLPARPTEPVVNDGYLTTVNCRASQISARSPSASRVKAAEAVGNNNKATAYFRKLIRL
jgi:hypothetical protein